MNKQMRSTRPYEVGYGKPPRATRFRKGQSGNPRGRTAERESLITVFKRLATKRVKVIENGIPKTISMAEAVITQNLRAALNQDQTAMGNIMRLAEHAGEFKDLTDPNVVGRPLILREKMSTEEFMAFHGVEVVQRPSSQTNGQPPE